MTTFADYSEAQIKALSLNEVAAMTPVQWATVKAAAFAGVTAAQLARFSTAQIEILSVEQLRAIKTYAMAGWSHAQLAQFSTAQIKSLSLKQLRAITIGAMAGLTAAQLASVSVVNLSGLSAEQVAAISSEKRSRLSDQQKNALLTATVRQDAMQKFLGRSGIENTTNSAVLTTTITVTQGTLELVNPPPSDSSKGVPLVTVSGNLSSTMTLSGTATAIEAALKRLAYTAPESFIGTAGLTIHVRDKALSFNIPDSQTCNEDTPLVFSKANGNAITVNDVDGNFTNGSYVFRIMVNGGTLKLGPTGPTATQGLSSHIWSFTHTVAAINSMLDGAVFTPIENYNGVIELTLQGANVQDKTLELTIGAVNDAPETKVQSTSYTFNEDTALVFSGANKNAITVDDVDSTALTTTVKASEGKLTLGNLASGATIKAGANNSASITLSGTALQINAALEGLKYTPLLNANGDKTLTVTTSDEALSSAQMITLNVKAVNDAATISGTSTAGLDETNAVLTAQGKLTLTDVDTEVSANPFIAQTSVVGNGKYGKFNLKSDGSWTYTTDTAKNDFVQGQIYTDSLDVETTDGTKGKITVSIKGTNDAPVFKLAGAQTFNGTSSTVLSLSPANTTLDNTFSVEMTATPKQAITLPRQSQGAVVFVGDYLLYPEQGGANAGFGLTVGTNGVVVSEHGDSQLAPLLVWAGAVRAGTKLAVVVTDKTPRLYVNGTLVAIGLRSQRNTLFVRPGSGIGGGAHGYYSGAASDLRYWDKALSPSEVATNYRTQPSLSAAKLNAVYLSGTGNKSTITENLANGTVVGQVFATDIDSPTLTYSLKGAGSDAFVINASSGEIRVKDATKLGSNSFGANRQVALDVTVSDGATAVVKTQMFTLAKINQAPVVTAPGIQTFDEDTARVFSSANGNAITVSDVETAALVSLNFDGTSASYLTVADTKLSGDITLEAWVNAADARKGWQRIFDFGNGSGLNNVLLCFEAGSGKLRFDNYGIGNYRREIVAATALGSGWHHVAVSVSAAGVGTIYVDGAAVASGDVGIVTSVARSNNYIGKSNWAADELFKGQIRDVRIWDIERSQAQIRAEMQTLSNPDAAGLRAWYPMSETTGNTVGNAAVVTVADGLSAADVVLVNTAVARPVAVTPITQTITQTTTLTTVLITTVATTEGTLALGSTNSGATIVAGANNSASITLRGTALQINAALEGLKYTPLLNANGSKTLTVTTSDGALSSTQTVNLTIAAVNDAAIISGDKTEDVRTLRFDKNSRYQIFVPENEKTYADKDSRLSTPTKRHWYSFSVSHGTLHFEWHALLGPKVVLQNGTNAIMVYGSGEFINRHIEKLKYTQSPGYVGVDVLEVESVDGKLQSVSFDTTLSKDSVLVANESTAKLESNGTRLEATGKLNITDVDSSMAFVAQRNVLGNGGYGKFTLHGDGSWSYFVDTKKDDFVAGKIYTDILKVKAVDGTDAKIVVIITGGENFDRSQQNLLTISSWSTNQLKNLTSLQWKNLNESQIKSINPESLAGFTIVEIFNRIPEASLKFLTINHYRALSVDAKSALDGTHFDYLGNRIFESMNAADVMGMTSLQRASMDPTQAQSLSIRVFQKLVGGDIDKLVTEYFLNKLSALQVRNIAVDALTKMSEKSFLMLLDGHFNKLVAKQIAVIPASFWAKVTSKQLESLHILSFQSLSTAQIKNINPQVIKNLSTECWSQFSKTQVASLTTSQINSRGNLEGLRVEGLTGFQIRSLPDNILDKLSASEISLLSLDAVKNLRLSQIPYHNDLNKFSAIQLSNISADVLKNLSEAYFSGLNKTKLTVLSERGIDVSRYLKLEASGALLAKIMLASFHILSRAGTYDKSKKGSWKELIVSFFDEIDKTSISLFTNEHINDSSSLKDNIWQKDSDGDVSALNFVKNNEIIISDDGRKYISKYVTSWQNPKPKNGKSGNYELGGYNSGKPIDFIADDVSYIYKLSQYYGLHYLLNNLRSLSVHNIIYGNNGISKSIISGMQLSDLGEAAFKDMDSATLLTLLQLNTYQDNFKQTGGAHESGSVSFDNPFGFGIVNTFSKDLFDGYLTHLKTKYNTRLLSDVQKKSGMFSDELWNDISDQVKLSNQLLNRYGSELTVSQMQRVSPNLFSSVSGETLLGWSSSRKDLFNAITPDQISVIPKASIKLLGEEIIGFNPIQFFAFTGIQIMGIATDSAWRKVHTNYSDIADKFVNEAPWHLSDSVILLLSPEQIVRLPEIVFERLLVTSMSRFTSTQVSSFSVSQVANLSAEQLVGLADNISYLSPGAVRSLTAVQYDGLTDRLKQKLAAVPLVKLPTAKIPFLLPNEMLDLNGKSFAKLSNEQLNSLTRAQVLSLLPSQYYSLSGAQRKELTGVPVFVLNRQDLKKLSLNDINGFVAEQFAFLSAIQLKALGKINFQEITVEKFKAIGSDAISTLLINNHEFLSDLQIINLELEQLAGLDHKTASKLSTKWQVLLEKNKDLSEYLVKVSTPAGRLATDLRAVYVATNNSRSMRSTLDHPYLNTGLFTKDWGDDRARLIFAAQEKFVLNQRKSAEQRALLQKGRAAGSALAFGAVISAWSMANRAGREGRAEDAAFFSLAGITYLCSLLQVPFSEAYAAVYTGYELQGAVENTAHKLTVATRDEQRAKRKSERNSSDVVLSSRYEEAVEAKRIAVLDNDAAKKALVDHNHMVKVNWGISNITGGLDQTDFDAAVELRKSQISLPKLDEIQMSQKNRELWKQHSKIFIGIDIKRQASRIFIAADLTSMASSGFKLSKAIRVNDSAEIAFGVVDMVGNILVLLGDAVDFIKVSGNATKMFAARLSGPGNVLIQCASAGLSIYSNVKYYQSNPNSVNARNAIIRDVVYQVVMLVVTVSLMSATPLLMVGAMVVMSIIPNAQAERILADLQDQQEKLLVEGRDVWANVVFTSLIKIAAMNLNGLTSIAANEVTAKVTSGLRESLLKHDSNLLRQLLSQDLRHYFVSQVTERTIDGKNVQVRAETIITITENIDKSNADLNPQATKIAAFFNINRQEVDLMSLYASKESEIASYATQLTVLASSAGVVNFDVNASNPLASNIDIELFDVAGSKEDSLIIVNVTSDLNLRNDKPINIVSNLESNVANFFVSASKVKIVGSLDQHSLITIVDSRADDLLVESKSGRDIVMFAGAPVDGEVINSTNQKIKQIINLDNFTNVAFVLAGATTMANQVRGTKARQRYSFNNGGDDINMIGGFGTAIVGGRKSEVLMGGGNNSVSVRLGSRAEYLPWASTDSAGVYDGGAVASSIGKPGDVDSKGHSTYSAGTNSISFSEAYGGLSMEILDPIQKAANNDILYSTVSTRIGPGIDMDVVDEGKFTNFQHIIGSNYGDLIKINRTNYLHSVTLGMGQNSVKVKDAVNKVSPDANVASLLHIMSLANLAKKESDVTIDNSDVLFTGGLASRNLLQISNSSNFIGDLRGNDRIFTDASSENVLDLTYSEGEHSLYLYGGSASVMMASDYSGDADIFVDSDVSKSVTLRVTLSGESSQQMVTRDAEGLHFSLMQENQDAQQVSYQFGASAAGLKDNYLTKFQMLDKSNTNNTVNNSYEISAAALNDAINVLSSSGTNSNVSQPFSFAQLYQVVFNKNLPNG